MAVASQLSPHSFSCRQAHPASSGGESDEIVLACDPAGIYKFYDCLRKLVTSEKVDCFSAHDPDAFKALKKPPSYYD